MPLYEIAVIEHPTKKDRDEEGKGDTLLLPIQPVMAGSEQAAASIAVMKSNLSEEQLASPRVEVLVRPFAV